VVNVNNNLREMTVRMWLINMPKEGETIRDVEPSGSVNIVSAGNSIHIRSIRDKTELGDVNKNDEYTQAG
jgi:hypothetical protein